MVSCWALECLAITLRIWPECMSRNPRKEGARSSSRFGSAILRDASGLSPVILSSQQGNDPSGRGPGDRLGLIDDGRSNVLCRRLR